MFYPERESRLLEFKSELPSFMQLIKTCVAFANGFGGKIIIGVKDKTKEIVGINEKIRDKIYDEFPNSLYDSTSPGLIAEIYEKNYGDVNVLIIEIPNVIKKPVFIKKEGIPKGVYLRAGSNTRQANEEHIEELMRENKRSTYDEEGIQEPIGILSDELLNKVYSTISMNKLISDKVIIQSATSSKKYYPTIAGILWFCENPDNYIPEAHIRCTRFAGLNNDREIIQTQEIGGSLIEQIENTLRLIKMWLQRDFSLKGARLTGNIIVPEDALREGIINAVVHRKYSIPGAVKVALFENRLEIFSPGYLPGLVDINNLGDGTTYLRNPVIAKIARKIEYMEKLGTGISLMKESCRKAGLKTPEFIEGADSVKVIFHFMPHISDKEVDEDKILKLFKMREEVNIPEVMKFLNISRNTATRKLNKMVESGQLVRVGKGPAVKYLIVK